MFMCEPDRHNFWSLNSLRFCHSTVKKIIKNHTFSTYIYKKTF